MKYQKLVNDFTQYIEDQQLSDSDQLPTVADLMLNFVSVKVQLCAV